MGNIGHNSTHDQLKGFVAMYVKCDEDSASINDERKGIRDKVSDLGLDTKAFQDAVSRAKKDRKKKEGYDESMQTMTEVLGDMNQDDLFAYLDRREEEREKERADRAKEREKQAQKAETFKPAAERKPKPGKTINPKDIGKEQAKALAKSHAN